MITALICLSSFTRDSLFFHAMNEQGEAVLFSDERFYSTTEYTSFLPDTKGEILINHDIHLKLETTTSKV
jgi:hypothetical protein